MLRRTESVTPMYFEQLTRREGLPSNTIICAQQDLEGFLWIGTENGLVRYDGSSVLVLRHDPDDLASIPDNSISTIVPGPDSTLLVGTLNGLAILDPATLRSVNYQLTTGFTGSRKVKCLHVDGDGMIWIGTMNGVFKLDPRTKALRHFIGNMQKDPVSRISKLNEVAFIIDDPRDTSHFLFGTNGGLVLFDKSRGVILRDYQHVISPLSGYHFGAYTAYLDNRMHLWTHGWVTGLNMFDLSTETWTDYTFGNDTVAISRILPGENSDIWISTLNTGLIHLDLASKTYACYKSMPGMAKSLLSDYTTSVIKDKEGRLWVLCDGGVCIEDKKYKSFKQFEVPFRHSWVSAFHTDTAAKRFYVGAYDCDGLFWLDQKTGKWHTIPVENGVKSGTFCINTLFRDSRNTLWVGSRNSLYYLDEKRGRLVLFRSADGSPLPLEDRVIYALFEDHHHNLWVGTRFEGVFRIDPLRTHVTHFLHREGDPASLMEGSHIRGIHEDQAGRIWIGTMQGFCFYDPAKDAFDATVQELAAKEGIGKRLVYSIEMDTLGRMWLSSDRQGLLRVSQTAGGSWEFKLFTTRHGLYDAEILYFSQDPLGRFWIVNNALVMMDPYSETFRSFSVYNGLHEIVNGDVKTYAGPDGTICFGDSHGYEMIGTQELTHDPALFNLVMEGIDVNGRKYPDFSRKAKSGRILFGSDERNLTFRFTAVSFNPLNQVSYQYFLEGYDAGWSEPDKGREVRYTNLPPGTYTFHVRARQGGITDAPERTVHFTVRQKVWKTWWFIVICLALVQLFAFAVYHYRRRHMVRLENLRTRIASDLHDDVSSTLSSISIMSSLVAKRSVEPQTSEMIAEIGNSARGMLEHMDDIIWAVNPKNDRFKNLGLRIREYAIPLFETREIRFRIECPDSLNSIKLPMDIRRNLFLITKEAVNNTVKYSGCSFAEIVFMHEHSRIQLMIRDNGKGFDPSVQSSRNGLRNMKLRAERIGGRFSLEAKPGGGTVIGVELKIR